MCGKLTFVWFSQTVNKASESIITAKSLIGKINISKTLFADDELCGFITAVAYVRPNRKLEEVKVKSVKKKMKDKAFARQVNRDEISEGAQKLNISLEDHIDTVIKAMMTVSKDLGL